MQPFVTERDTQTHTCPQESGGTVTLCPLQSRRPAIEPLFPAFYCAFALSRNCCAACSTTLGRAPGTRDSDPPATKSVNNSVKRVCFAEQKGLAN